MFSCEKVVWLLTLLLVKAQSFESLQIHSCKEYSYFYTNESKHGTIIQVIRNIILYFLLAIQISFITWDELIDALPTLKPTGMLCRDLHGATFKMHSGKLVGINTIKLEFNDDGTLVNGSSK